MTVRDLLTALAETDRPGLRFEDREWSWREVVAESAARASVLAELLDTARPPHVGVLLDNVPEFAFTLGGAALGGEGLAPGDLGAQTLQSATAFCNSVIPKWFRSNTTFAILLFAG